MQDGCIGNKSTLLYERGTWQSSCEEYPRTLYNNEQAKANQRIMDAAQTLENASPYITEWDESAVRQLVETVKILSKDEVAVTLKGGIEICQKIMY